MTLLRGIYELNLLMLLQHKKPNYENNYPGGFTL